MGPVDIWLLPVRSTLGERLLTSHGHVLSADERLRADRFQFEVDRNLHVLGRVFLRETLARYLGCTPATVKFAYGPRGKPHIADQINSDSVYFNLTHTRQLIGCVVSLGSCCGIDLEHRQPRECLESIAQLCFTPTELSYVFSAEEERVKRFYRLWTLKEAYVKARGEGLYISPLGFAFSFLSQDLPSIEYDPGFDSGPADMWHFLSMEAPFQHSLAIAVRRTAPAPLLYRLRYPEAPPEVLRKQMRPEATQLADWSCFHISI
jgi:4'-phosphopantetheinyl transferase